MAFTPVQTLANIHVLLNTLGILAVANALLLFFSCRFIPMLAETLQVKVMQNRIFKFVYKYHPYYWWSFWLILLLHILTGIAHNVYAP
jgi:hypothetical protein